MKLRHGVQLGLGVGVSAFFVWLTLRAIPVDELMQALATVRPEWICAALASFALGYACRIQRWRLMLRASNPRLGWGRCAVPFMASIAANNLLPFRAGDALRAVGFSGWLGAPTAGVLATLVAERMMDLLALLIALGLALLLLAPDAASMETLVGSSALLLILLALGVAGALLFPQALRLPLSWALRLLRPRAPGLAEKIEIQAEHLFGTLGSIAERPRMAVLMGWSMLAWGFEAGVFYTVARAIPGLAEPAAAWLAMPVGTLSTLLPSTPGYVGTFHYFVMSATTTFANDQVSAGAFAVLAHLALWIPATLWGGASFVYWTLARARAGQSIKEARIS